MNEKNIRIGIDIGGTFTDFVFLDECRGDLTTFKVLSTPENPARAVLNGLETLPQNVSRQIIHGSTVATNALLERKGAKTALITTTGFRDILVIGRQNRQNIYALLAISKENPGKNKSADANTHRPAPLIPPELTFEINERVDHQGEVLTPIDLDSLKTIIERMKDAKVESVAISFLFSFLMSEHEEKIASILRENGFRVSASSKILPEFREYERTSTTAINAYVSPVMDRYISNLSENLKSDDFWVLQSNGGRIKSGQACEESVRTILSGPAGGVVGAFYHARIAGFDRIITFDMGGTSTDVSLCDGSIQVTKEGEIGGLPIRVPIIDIHTVGSGGGSIARMDAGGALRVGPQSAGANPGPVCYGRGGKHPTVTDANLTLGRLSHLHFLGGQMQLDFDAAKSALNDLALHLNLEDFSAALGIIQIADTHMERALRLISVEKGYDPGDFVLVSFGGAGGLHSCNLARALGIKKVLIPKGASTLSAFGMLASDVVKDYVQTIMLPGHTDYKEINELFKTIKKRGQQEIAEEGIDPPSIFLYPQCDIRYKGQSYELTIPFSNDFIHEFHKAHYRHFGHMNQEGELEIVNLRLKAVGKTPEPPIRRNNHVEESGTPQVLFKNQVVLSRGFEKIPFYSGETFQPGHVIEGPGIIIYKDTTVFIDADNHGTVDDYFNLILNVGS